MKHFILAAAFGLMVACAAAPSAIPEIGQSEDARAIKSLLETQQTAWNEGNIDGFMDGYWRSSQLRFASGGNVTRGWQETRDRYHANYSDRQKMGQLDFSDLEVNQLSKDAAILHGRWKLIRAQDTPHGLFTLVLRKIDGQWLIVSDTTTSGGS